MKRVVSLVAWCLALAVLALTAAPAALAQEDPPPPLGDDSFDSFDDGTLPPVDDVDGFPPPDDLFGDPGELGDPGGFGEVPVDGFTYPPEWDLSKPDIVAADYVAPGVVVNTVTGIAYDPLPDVVILTDGTVLDHATGDVLGVDPFWVPPLEVAERGADPQPDPVDIVEPIDDTADPVSEPGTETLAEPAEAEEVSPVTEFESLDPVLEFYRIGFAEADLAPYALDIEALPPDAIDDTFQFLAYEIALLFEAGAFVRDTPYFETFQSLHAQFDFDGTPNENLVRTFTAVDLEFARRSILYRDALDPADHWSVDWAIAELEPSFSTSLIEGERQFMVGFEYAAALARVVASGPEADLATTGAAESVQLGTALSIAVAELEIQRDINELLRADNDALRALLDEFTEPSIAAALTVVDGGPAADPDTGSDQTLVFVAAGGGAAVLLLAAFLLLRRGRRARSHRPDDAELQDEAMATSHLLAGAKNATDIVEILDRAGERQVNAGLVLFHVLPDGLRRVGGQETITGSELQRVVSTGHNLKTTLRADPAFPGTNRAVLAMPVIHEGAVAAVLAAHRDESASFGEAERKAMDLIAPGLGGALKRSEDYGTMKNLAMVDGLTSLGNRRRLDGDLETTLATAVAGDAMLGFAMVDVDHFKTYNDTHGHTAGDEVLRRVAATIAQAVRETDVVYRYGGEEFSMLLPGATPDEVAAVAERVRAAVEAEPFPGEELQPGGKLTVSIGVATLESGVSDDIRERADSALYDAKKRGRNQVAYG